MKAEPPPDPFGAVGGEWGGPREVPDVSIDHERIARALADELLEPAVIRDLAAVGLSVLQDLDSPDAPVRLQGHHVVDHEVLANHVVDDEEADRPIAGESPPHLLAAGAYLLARAPFDGRHVRRLEHDVG